MKFRTKIAILFVLTGGYLVLYRLLVDWYCFDILGINLESIMQCLNSPHPKVVGFVAGIWLLILGFLIHYMEDKDAKTK